MPGPPTELTDTGSPQKQPAKPVSEKHLRFFEVFLVLLVAFGNSFFNSLYLMKNGPGATANVSNTRWIIGIINEVTALLLLGYVMSRRGRRFRDLGLQWSMRDVGLGVIVTAAAYLSSILGSFLLQAFFYNAVGTLATAYNPRDFYPNPSLATLPYSVVNPFFEELIVRAYLMTEIVELTGSGTLAVVLSVVVQACYHLYYGWLGALIVLFQVLIFALYYAHSRRALPIIVAHGCFDLLGLVRSW